MNSRKQKTNAIAEILSSGGNPTLPETLSVVFALALPAIIEQIMVTLVQYIDTAMVGSLGYIATASVGLTASSTWLINGILNASAVGFSVQIAHYVGANDIKDAKSVTGQALKFTLMGGIVMWLVAFLISWPLPHWLGAAEDLMVPASLYFRIYSFGVPFNFCILMLSSIIRCAGDTKTPMYLNFGINIINVVFNYLLIYETRMVKLFGFEFKMYGAGMGVAGAALGSVIALAAIGIVYLIVIFKRESLVQISLKEKYPFEKRTLSAVLKLGTPVLFERLLMSGAQVVQTSIIARIGTVAVASNSLAVTAESLSYMPANGVSTAATTLVGQALGAGRKDMAKRFSKIIIIIGLVMMTFGGAVLFIFNAQLISIFTADPAVIELGGRMLKIVAFAEPFFALSIVGAGVLRGAGDTKTPFIISLITMWGVRITMAFALYRSLGLKGVWIAMATELVCRGTLYIIRVIRGKWLNLDLIKK